MNGSAFPSQCHGYKCHGKACCSFSEQELVDCTNKGTDDCDTGGEMHDGITEIVKNHGGASKF
jgi:hypothetical protein